MTELEKPDALLETLINSLLSVHMEYTRESILECLQEDTEEGKILRAVRSSMKSYAREIAEKAWDN